MSKQPKEKPYIPWTPEEEEFVRECYGKLATKDIARLLGRKVPMVYSKANDMGLYITGPRPREESLLHSLRDLYQGIS